MMKRPRKRVTFVSIIFGAVLIGVVWGLHLNRQFFASEKDPLPSRGAIQVLAYKGLLSTKLLEEFEKRTKIRVQVDEADNPEDLWEKLEASVMNPAPTIDLVTLFSFQVPLAIQLARIQPVHEDYVPNMKHVSPDFRYLPGETAFDRVLPVLWGVLGIAYHGSTPVPPPRLWSELFNSNRYKGQIALPSSTSLISKLGRIFDTGQDLRKTISKITSSATIVPNFMSAAAVLESNVKPNIIAVHHGEMAFAPFQSQEWNFMIPEEGGIFWSLVFALHPDSKKTREAHEFLNFLLEFDSAVELTQSFRQASTNRQLEGSRLDARLKPSYLRQLPLPSLDIPRDFSRARELRELLKKAEQGGN